jgi:DNA-binding NarL/FixJ family response regulator
MTVTVLVADDQELVRTGFRMILNAEPDIHVVGEVSTGSEAVRTALNLRPDIILMDIRMPTLDGIAATRLLAEHGQLSTTRVLILTTFDLDEYVFDAIQAGASGFLLKDTPANQLVSAVRMVAAGDALIAPTITRRLIEEFVAIRRPTPTPPGFDDLTPREVEIFKLIAKGLSNLEIARELIIGESTVKTHVTRILMKLNLRDRVQAVVLAYQAGIASPDHRPNQG